MNLSCFDHLWLHSFQEGQFGSVVVEYILLVYILEIMVVASIAFVVDEVHILVLSTATSIAFVVASIATKILKYVKNSS